MKQPLVVLVAVFAQIVSIGPAVAQTYYAARLDSAQVQNNFSNSTATGEAFFELNAARTQLSYWLQLHGLDLDPVMESRTDPNDVVGIHIHLHVPDVIGPHILNIFGNPSEDDADLVVDYENESLTGIFDISDATRDEITGEIVNQAFPLTTKIIGDWLDELAGGELYIAVHSIERTMNASPGVDIRGDIYQIPEPSTRILLLMGIVLARPRSRQNQSLVSGP